MNIQIFGTKKCKDTKKAERFFKERGIKYQFIDMQQKGMSQGELRSVAGAVGGMEQLVNPDAKDRQMLALLPYLSESAREEKLLDYPELIKTPVVRNGRQAAIGYQPDVWKGWE